MAKCVCNAKRKQKCRYHATYPDGRPYEPLLSTPFLNFLYRMDREHMQQVDEARAEGTEV